MIPVLYSKSETDFTKNGIGPLTDTIKASVTEERNGTYEASIQYPLSGSLFSEIKNGSVVKMKANDTGDPQLFRIYRITKPINGIITCYLEHISYDLNGIPLPQLSISHVTPDAAITYALQNNPFGTSLQFEAWSDISAQKSINISSPCSVRSLLGGIEGSILDLYGGEYEFDNFTVKLHTQRGSDNGVTIEYGKNLVDLKQESNIAEMYTHVFPFAHYRGENNDVYVFLSETPTNQVIALTGEDPGHIKTLQLDLTSLFSEGEEMTPANLRSKTNAYISSHDLGKPKVSITVSFTQLWQSPEYASIAPLEKVQLCDTVTVRFTTLGVLTKAKVIKTVFDSLTEKYESITLGDAKSSFADTIISQEKTIVNTVRTVNNNKSIAQIQLQRAIANATAAITGNSGGNVVLYPPNNPQEILILDNDSVDTAKNVWRWNASGLGFSSNGYEGPFETAITADGHIVADFVDTGKLNASLITTGYLNADLIHSGKITSDDGNAYFDLDQGEMLTKDSSRYAKLSEGWLQGGEIVDGGAQRCGYISFARIYNKKSVQIRAEENLVIDVPGQLITNSHNAITQELTLSNINKLGFTNGILTYVQLKG